jgi:hypothetical protein
MANTGALGSPDQKAAQQTPQPASSAAALSPFSGTTASLLASPNWQNEISGYLAGQAAPTAAQGALSGSVASGELGLVGPQEGVSAGELQNSTGYDLANALLGQEGLGLQSQGLASQASTAAKQQGVEEAQYGVQSTQYPEQQAEAALANQNAVISNRDSAAIGGTTDTTSAKRTASTQAAQYGWQQADIYRNQQLAQLGQQSEEQGYGGQEEQFANQRQQLALAAQGEGLTAQQAQSQLGFGLQQLGVNASPEQYLSTIANAQGSEASTLAGVGSQAALIGGLGANFLGG